MTKEELKNRVLNGGRGSGQSLRLLCEVYENRIEELERKLEQAEKDLADYQFNYPTIKELEKENKIIEGCLLAEQEHTQMLEQQIEKMKICPNCKFEDNDYMEKPCCECSRCLGDIKRKGASDKWEIKENDKRYM